MSDATEILETDFEDDGSDFETTSHKGSFESISVGLPLRFTRDTAAN